MVRDLRDIREELDEIDESILRLFEKRMEISKDVAAYKKENNKPVLDKDREVAKINKLLELSSEGTEKELVNQLFQQIMSCSRTVQLQFLGSKTESVVNDFKKVNTINIDGIKVAYQGMKGAYSNLACEKYFGSNCEFINLDTFEEVMEKVNNNEVEFGVVPLANSSVGPVILTYDLLANYNNYIVDEIYLPVHHCLMSTKDASINTIKKVYAHPQSFMQSSKYLEKHENWETNTMKNNAFAAKKVADSKDNTKAAIGSELAAKVYDLKIIDTPINNEPNNCTRFIVLSNKKIYKNNANRVSICFSLPHEAGSLCNILGNFLNNGLNMVSIESRPIPQCSWEYRFFVDFEGNLSHNSVKNALNSISDNSLDFKILGNY